MTRAALACLLLAACAEPTPDGELTITAPPGTAELLPGGTTPLGWTWTGGAADLRITLAPLGGAPAYVLHDAPIAAGDGVITWDGRDLDGAVVPPSVYDLGFEVVVGGDPVAVAVRNLAVHGMTFTDPAPGETLVIRGSEVPVHVRLNTVSHRVILLTLSVGPHAFDERSIPGEWVPYDRQIDFPGVDLDGAPIPAGVYPITVDVLDQDDDDLAYRTVGGMVDWRPGE